MDFPFIRTISRRPETSSTSNDARLAVLEGSVSLPLLVLANRQTAGRGRGENAWWSDAGSLTMTLALDPLDHGLRPDHEPRLALATAVVLIDVVSSIVPDAPLRIRWPNDVESDGRKLAGILPERVDTPFGPRLLIGVGLNVSTRLEDAPEDVRSMATSVDALRGSESSTPPFDLVSPILDRFSIVLDRLASDDPSLAARWAELDTLLDRPVRLDLGTRIVEGIGRGIDARGGLVIAEASGIRTHFGGRVLR